MPTTFARGGRGAIAVTLLLLIAADGARAQPMSAPPIPGYPVVQAAATVPQPIAMPPVAAIPAVFPAAMPPESVTPLSNLPTGTTLPTPFPSLDPSYAADPIGGGSPIPSIGAGGPTTGGAGPGPRGADYASQNLSVFLGGRAQLDAVDYITTDTLRRNIPGVNPLNPGVSFRRLRLDASGSIYKHIDYLFQVDFVNSLTLGPGGPASTDVAVPTDAWVTFKDLPIVGNLRIGNHKPLYSFEHLTSSRYLNFMERSLGFDAFAEGFDNGFEPGISIFDTYLDKRGTWGVGVFKNTRSPFAFNVGRNEVDVNGRVTYLPIYEEEGKYLMHVGLGASQRDPDAGQVRFRSRFDARNSPSGISPLIADTGLFNAAQQYLLIPEFVAVCGPLSIQSEYYASWVTDASTIASKGVILPQGTAFLHSWYVEGHLFLTGEHRAYNRGSGVFGAVKPLKPVAWTRDGFTGWGAWQLTARYSYLDLNSKQVLGGRVNDMTLGLNWFLNQYMKVQGNFFLADRDAVGTAGDGVIYGFGTRFAIDF